LNDPHSFTSPFQKLYYLTFCVFAIRHKIREKRHPGIQNKHK